MFAVRDQFRHERYGWLDQARGIVGLLFTLASITWAFRGNVVTGEPIVAPTYLDHGYNYYKDYPSMITIIDLGQAIFLFMVGVSAYIAFSSRLHNGGAAGAWGYVARRVSVLWVLSALGELINRLLSVGTDWAVIAQQYDWYKVLVDDVLARIAIGALAAYAAIFFVRNADGRALLAVAIFTVHAFAYALYAVDRYPWWDDMMLRPQLPMGAFNLAGAAILGTAFGEWIRRNPEDLRVGMRERIVPVALWCLVASYCLEWLQHSEAHDATSALVLMASGLSGLMLMMTYSASEIGIAFPLLTPIGRNLLLVFIMGILGTDIYYAMLGDEFLRSDPLILLFFGALAPLLFIIAVTQILHRFGLVIRA